MRPFLFCLIGLLLASSDPAIAQLKAASNASSAAGEVRYFTSIEVMDGDVILRETRQGKTVTAAALDVCYRAERGSDRKDRFVANLAVNGQTMTGTTQSIRDKLPVSVKLLRKPTGNSFEFKGEIIVGQTAYEITSTDNSDVSEKEFLANQPIDESILRTPYDFTEVSPESIGVRLKLDAAVDFLKALKGQDIELSLNSLAVSCEALRAGEQTINMSVDPARASSLIAKFKSLPGVVAAGWTSGAVDMERTIRFAANDWRDGDGVNRDKIAAAITNVLTRTLAAKSSVAAWNAGKLKLTFKRPSRLLPALELTETIEVAALVAADKLGATDRLILWISNPVITTADESAGPKLNLSEAASGDEEGEQQDDSGSVEALAKEFKAQRWDPEASSWE